MKRSQMLAQVRRCLAVIVLIIGLSLTANAAKGSKKVLLTTDFETNPLEQGWSNSGAGVWTDATACSGKHAITCTNPEGNWELWTSPAFPVKPFEYYRLRFSHKGAGNGNNFSVYSYNAQDESLTADNWDAFASSTDWQTVTMCFNPAFGATHARIVFRAEEGKTEYLDDVTVTPVTHSEVAAWADQIAAGMPKMRFKLPADRCQYIPRTMQALKEGKTLRIVMLGDSIVNDTGNSQWGTLVERLYPNARLEIVRSVRGSTGCMYYEKDNNIKPFVLDYAPDLLMIGGISNIEKDRTSAEAIASIRNVIRQVRAATKCEILVMTGAMAKVAYNPRVIPNWQATVDPQGTGFRNELARLAMEEQVAFLDMAGAWGTYTLAAEQPYDWFLRDDIHGNWRAKQVVGRVLEAFFAPK